MPEGDEEPPASLVDQIERLTREHRRSGREDLLERRERLLERIGYRARIRTDPDGDTLVLYPTDWVEDGTVDPATIDEVDRGIERPLEAPGDPEDWGTIDEHNRAVVAAVEQEHGSIHAKNAAALADFMGNHYARPIEELADSHREEFLSEYYPRNAWPSEEQREVVEKSVTLAVRIARNRDQ